LDIEVSEYSLLNYNSAESRILSNLIITLISKISDAVFLLNKVFLNSALAGEGKLKAN
jgi:hypothetical protein